MLPNENDHKTQTSPHLEIQNAFTSNYNNNSSNNINNKQSTTYINKPLFPSTTFSTFRPQHASSITTKSDKKNNKQLQNMQQQLQNMQQQLESKIIKIEEYQVTICDLRSTLNDRLVELNTLKLKLNKSPERNLVTDSLRDNTLDREETLGRLKKKHLDVEKLKKVIETLMISNEEKNNKIDELTNQLDKHKKLCSKLNTLPGGEEIFVECGLRNLEEITVKTESPDATNTPVSLQHYNVINNKSNSCTNIQQQDVKTPPTGKRKPLLSASSNYQHNIDESLKDEMAQEYKHLQRSAVGRNRSTGRSIRRLFSRIRRSTSQEFNGKTVDFKRSTALRSTTGLSNWVNKVNKGSFSTWDTDTLCTWLNSMGLSCYVSEVRKSLKSGEQLLNMSSHQMQKELGIKNSYHRRKLQLAMQVMTSEPNSSTSNMDHHAVQKWLDDIGLPQYKDAFMHARMDGRMLNYLTNDDLFQLKVTNQLHQLSIRSAIYILRYNKFNINSLIRRPLPEEFNKSTPAPAITHICLWTNHRVMDWLRVVDLCEYAPNLRGSGVHGGLMILEPRFSADILASILSISNNKSLLRRHLNTHFVSLVGTDVQQAKRTYAEKHPDIVVLTTTLKVKAPKKANLFRSRNSCNEFKDDFVCPFDPKLLTWSRDLLECSNERRGEEKPIKSPDVLQVLDKDNMGCLKR